MEALELILKILPILAVFAGLVRYLISEVEKRKEREVKQLMDLRNQIINDSDIAHIMFLCENNSLTNEFYKSECSDANSKLYKEVSKTLGLVDSVCYTFLNNNLSKNVFFYFLGELQEIIMNPIIQVYLDYLLIENVRGIINEKINENLLFISVYPYGYFQVCMRLNSIEIAALSSRKLKKRINMEKSKVNKTINRRFFVINK